MSDRDCRQLYLIANDNRSAFLVNDDAGRAVGNNFEFTKNCGKS